MATFHEAYVCVNCLLMIANGEELEDAALDDWAPSDMDDSVWWMVGDSGKDYEFSREACDCCRTSLAGSRHHVYFELKEGENESSADNE